METRAHYVAVGAFVIIIIALAFVAVLWLSRFEISQVEKNYYIFFKGSVAGLNKGSAVQYNGIPVGRVSDIRVDPDNIAQIQVTVAIDSSLVAIKSDARAFLDTNLLSGASTIQIRGGTQEARELEPQSGHKYPIIKPGRSELEEVKASLPELTAELKTAAANLNALLDERNRQAVADSLQNLRTLTAALAGHSQEVGTILDNANTALGSANSAMVELHSLLHNVDQSYTVKGGLKDQLSQTLKDYDRVAGNLTDTTHQLQLAIGDLRPGLRNFVQTTLPGVDDFVNDAQLLAGNLNQFVVQLQRDPTRLLFGDRRQGYQPR
jgi:phospholipid/cholesterol/gamma-HCH transport system substrate-binding protein